MTAAERIASREQAPVRFTAAEFMELVQHPPISDWVGKIELIDGEIVRMSPTNLPHWRMQQEVAQQLRSIFADRPGGLVGPEATVRFDKRSIRLPDVGAFRDPGPARKVLDVADLFLAVEIADTTLRHDLGRKRAAYAEAGVPHYWVVDVNGRKVHVMAEPEAGDYGSKRVVPFGDPIDVPHAGAAVVIG